MVTDAILAVLFTPIGWLLEVLPSITYPDWFSAAHDNGVTACSEMTVGCQAYMAGQRLIAMDGWVDIDMLFVGVGLIAAAWAAVLGWKAARIVVSLFTGGGGA